MGDKAQQNSKIFCHNSLVHFKSVKSDKDASNLLPHRSTTTTKLIFFEGQNPWKKVLKALKKYHCKGLIDTWWTLKQIPSEWKFLRPSWPSQPKFQHETNVLSLSRIGNLWKIKRVKRTITFFWGSPNPQNKVFSFFKKKIRTHNHAHKL